MIYIAVKCSINHHENRFETTESPEFWGPKWKRRRERREEEKVNIKKKEDKTDKFYIKKE